MALFSGGAFEAMFIGRAWPCSLPSGWSVVWDGLSAGADSAPPE